MIRYMVVVLARPIFGSHCLVEEQLLEIKFDCLVQVTEQLLVRLGIATSASSTGPMLVATDDLYPMGTCRTSSVGSGYRTSPANCDDPVHGSGPGNNSSKSSSTGQNCELMGRPVMQKEITYVCYSSSMLVLSDDLHPMASSRELPPRQLETSETAWINWTTSASSTGCLDHVPSLMTYNEPATPFGKN